MKVLQVGKYYPPHRGGMETVLKDICETLRDKMDVEVVVAGETRERMEESIGGAGLTRLACWGTLFSQPLTPGILSALRNTTADMIHLHEPNPLAVAAYLLSRAQLPLVIHYHSDIVRQKTLRRIYWPLLRRALDRSSAIIAGSSQLIESSPVLAPYKHKCVVIPFGIDLEQWETIDREEARPGKPLVLAVGRLIYYKGFEYLIDAMAQLDADLVIAGEGPERERLEWRIASAGLSEKVKLAGRVSNEELRRLYERASVFCLSSTENSEAFGLVMVEAMAAGLPVVSTDLPTGVRSVNVHGKTGLVVEPRDAGALASALSLLISRPELRMEMGRAGRKRARAEFSREVMGRRIAEVYQEIRRTADIAQLARALAEAPGP